MTGGFRMMRELMAADAMAPLRGAEYSPGEEVAGDDEILDWIRNNSQTAYHPIGTCRMGAEPGGRGR